MPNLITETLKNLNTAKLKDSSTDSQWKFGSFELLVLSNKLYH